MRLRPDLPTAKPSSQFTRPFPSGAAGGREARRKRGEGSPAYPDPGGSASPDFLTSRLAPRPPRHLEGPSPSPRAPSLSIPCPSRPPPAGRAALPTCTHSWRALRAAGPARRSAPPDSAARPALGPGLLAPASPTPAGNPARAGLLRGIPGKKGRASEVGPGLQRQLQRSTSGCRGAEPAARDRRAQSPVAAHSSVPLGQVARETAGPSPFFL